MAPTAYPRIAGLSADYLAKQLRDFRAGTRNNPLMRPMASRLSDAEIAAISTYYAALPIPAPVAEPPARDVTKTAAELARWGDWSGRGLPGCGQCHGPDGNGIGSGFPGISGQQASYIEAQLQAWKTGVRANDPMGLMKAVADRLTDVEIHALAAYYNARPGAPPTPAGKTLSPSVKDEPVPARQLDSGDVPHHGPPPAGRTVSAARYFEPPSRDAMPGGPLGNAILQGQAIFDSTNTHPLSSKYVGNRQTCGNCHLDAGRRPGSAPLWAAWVAYPAYRTKDDEINTYIERIQGCFRYSMNAQASVHGGPPAAHSETMTSLVAYSYWLAKGALTGDLRMPGRGYVRLKETSRGFDPGRGAAVYAAKCALCHGEDGAGVAHADGRTLFPPLWGAGSYNWGAGMHRVDTAAAFIKHNMPLGVSGVLSDQEAWDVAAFVNSHERPQDPRHRGDLALTTSEFHASKFDYYGKRKGPDGRMLGER